MAVERVCAIFQGARDLDLAAQSPTVPIRAGDSLTCAHTSRHACPVLAGQPIRLSQSV